MKIDVGRIKNIAGQVMELNLQEKLADLPVNGDHIRFASPVRFTGQVENLGEQLQVEGHFQTSLELICSRCLTPGLYEVRAPISQQFTVFPTVAEADPTAEISLFSGDEIDLTPYLIQNILLELPMKFLCRKKCRGLCQVCGANLNHHQCQCTREEIDPRFLALKKLVKPSSTEGGVNSGSTKKKNI